LSQHAAVGRLSQVCRRWIYSACLCFGLDLDEQQRRDALRARADAHLDAAMRGDVDYVLHGEFPPAC
jgi:hypothetical protein